MTKNVTNRQDVEESKSCQKDDFSFAKSMHKAEDVISEGSHDLEKEGEEIA